MPYFALPNFNHDSGPNRIQSGPNHEGYIVLYSGVESTGPNNGIVVGGAPLSGSPAGGTWDYDSNWRYVPSTLPGQSGSLDPTPYNVSGALDTYNAARIYTRDNVAGAQAASAIGPETGKVNPRGAALQPRADVTRPEKYMYFGGGAPDNQDYSPYNTPDANTAAEGKTGGGVTHRNYESTLLTNLLGSQGTSDRSQWRYHQPVYCETFTETQRSATPGLMSSPLRYIYRGSATSYAYNYGGELLANKGGFQLLPPDDQKFGCPFPVGCPTTNGDPVQVLVGDILSAVVYCSFNKIEWFNSNNIKLGEGTTYTVTSNEIGYNIYYKVTYNDGSTDQSSINCFDSVLPQINQTFYWLNYTQDAVSDSIETAQSLTIFDDSANMYTVKRYQGAERAIVHKVSNNTQLIWSSAFQPDSSQNSFSDNNGRGKTVLVDSTVDTFDIFYQRWTSGSTQPCRIYVFTVSKLTGALLNTRTIVYTPSTATGSVDDRIYVVKNENFYYMARSVQINSFGAILTLTKFDENLNALWTKQVNVLESNCVSTYGSIVTDLKIINNRIFVSLRYEFANNFANRFTPVAFSIDLDGSAATVIKPIILQPGVTAFQYVLYSHSVETDDLNSFYVVGGFNVISIGSNAPIGVTLGPVVRLNASGQIVWAVDLISTLSSAGGATVIQVYGQNLVSVRDKLVFVGSLRTASGSPPTFAVAVFILSKDTGFIEDCIVVRSSAPTNVSLGAESVVNKMPQNKGFIITTSMGYRMRFNIDNIPSSGTYPFIAGSGSYSISKLTPVQSGVSNLIEVYPGPCTNFNVVDSTINPFYTVDSTVSGVTVPPSGTFNFGRIATV